jgi:hypothetical protein
MKRAKPRTNPKGRASGGESFVMLINSFRRQPAWRDLTYGAQALYVEVKALHKQNPKTGSSNNGQLYLSVRKAAKLLNTSRSSTERWFRELVDHGFLVSTGGGSLGVDGEGTATYWRLTELGYMNQRPTADYKNWKPPGDDPGKNNSPSLKRGQGVAKMVQGVSPKRGQVSLKWGHPGTENCQFSEGGCHQNGVISRSAIPGPARAGAPDAVGDCASSGNGRPEQADDDPTRRASPLEAERCDQRNRKLEDSH